MIHESQEMLFVLRQRNHYFFPAGGEPDDKGSNDSGSNRDDCIDSDKLR